MQAEEGGKKERKKERKEEKKRKEERKKYCKMIQEWSGGFFLLSVSQFIYSIGFSTLRGIKTNSVRFNLIEFNLTQLL